MKPRSFNTAAVHAGEDRSENYGALSVPIYTASVFAFSDADEGIAIHNYDKPGYFYGRLGNPTQTALERSIAELEGGEDALALASGMAATSAAILTFAKLGDHIVAPQSMYATTANLFGYLRNAFGIETTFIDATEASNYRQAAVPNTKIFWIETPSNPRLHITDIRAVVAIAKELGVSTVVDNTFATPYNQRPLELGVDAVIHSATKYLGGHSDLTAGILVGSSPVVEKARHEPSKFFGGNIAPQVAWLVLRGIKTLALRMERHNENALHVAITLADKLGKDAVLYPGLSNHPNHQIAVDQMRGFGGMVGLDLRDGEAARSFVNRVELCTFATSLGGVETIIQPSALMTHATLSPEARSAAGISDGYIRISVGIEDAGEIVADILHAMA